MVGRVLADVTGYDIATLAIAVAGLTLAILSLVWRAATFFLSGSGVRVELRRGALVERGSRDQSARRVGGSLDRVTSWDRG